MRHAQTISDATTNAANARLTAVLDEIWQLRQEADKERKEAKEDNHKFREAISKDNDKFREAIFKDRKEAQEENNKFRKKVQDTISKKMQGGIEIIGVLSVFFVVAFCVLVRALVCKTPR